MQDVLNQIQPQVQATVSGAYEVASLALAQAKRATELALAQSKQNAAFARQQIEAAANLKDPTAVLQFFQSQMEASAKYAAAAATEAFELSQEFQAELSGYAESHFDAQHAEVNALIAKSLKNAPQGSEAAVAAFKQAVEAGNNALGQARQTARQVAEVTKQNIEQVKGKVVAAKPATRRRSA